MSTTLASAVGIVGDGGAWLTLQPATDFLQVR